MQRNKKILINSIAVYAKIAVNTIATLVATKIVLQELGAYEFGLYNLIAGVIVMLSFLNTALVFSIQRFLSIAMGEGNHERLEMVYNTGTFLHVAIAAAVVVVFLLIKPLLFCYVLNIEEGYVATASVMYYIMIASAAVTLLSIPFSALIQAYDDIYYFAITEAIAGLLKLGAAVAIIYIASEKLIAYTVLMVVALIIGFLLKYLWCGWAYGDVKIRFFTFDKAIVREISGFIGWNTLGSTASLIKSQGVAILLNSFLGAIINAAYGIASQVNGLINTMSATMTTVFTPTIMRLHGEGNDLKMWKVAKLSSRLSFIVSASIAIPVIVYLPQILDLWLGTYPESTVMLCRLVFLPFLLCQMTAGFNRVVYAIGRVNVFMRIYFAAMASVIPIGYVVLKLGMGIEYIFYAMIIAQLLISYCELYYSHKYTGLGLRKEVVQHLVIPIAVFCVLLCVCWWLAEVVGMNPGSLGVVMSVSGSCVAVAVVGSILILSKEEIMSIRGLLKR